jgi:L-threonylcarbamoyladenylate synthase
MSRPHKEADFIAHAIQLLNSGNVVAIPTETVYGLAAAINSPEGINKIFSVKQRPFFDPLIVHVSSIEQAKTLVKEWPPAVDCIAQHFWPGPLTMVLEKNHQVSDLITSGLPTVGIRMPQNELTLNLIRELNIPLAAPSANKFGKTSPTTAEHVLKEFQDQVFVIDGGPCEAGIESTIISLQEFTDAHSKNLKLTLLRPGIIIKTQIEDVLKKNGWKVTWTPPISKQMAPGQMKHHYMPPIPLIMGSAVTDEHLIHEVSRQINLLPLEIDGVKIIRPNKIQKIHRLILPEDANLCARQLYSELRKAAETKADIMFFELTDLHQSPDWEAVMDRMKKAASLIL